MAMRMVDHDKYIGALEKMCDEYCKMPGICETQEILDKHCNECPMNTLFCEDVEEESGNP